VRPSIIALLVVILILIVCLKLEITH
jgi:hypothetical protein